MDTHIQIKNLSVRYGDLSILDRVNVEFPRHQITVIMGPSGCGKTTLLKGMNRFLELVEGAQVSGQVMIDGEDIYAPNADATEIRKRIGLMAQRPYPLPMSIYDNVAYGMRIHRMVRNGAGMDVKVRHYLEEAGLWDEVKDRLHSPAAALSLGQQQRLCLARGLAVNPTVLLGDEPTSALDPISAQHIEQRLLALKQEYTIILVTHILRQAKRLADFVVFMYLGELVECGPAREVFERPQKERTRAYLAGQF